MNHLDKVLAILFGISVRESTLTEYGQDRQAWVVEQDPGVNGILDGDVWNPSSDWNQIHILLATLYKKGISFSISNSGIMIKNVLGDSASSACRGDMRLACCKNLESVMFNNATPEKQKEVRDYLESQIDRELMRLLNKSNITKD